MLTANHEAKIGDVGLGKLVANPNAIATQQGIFTYRLLSIKKKHMDHSIRKSGKYVALLSKASLLHFDSVKPPAYFQAAFD